MTHIIPDLRLTIPIPNITSQKGDETTNHTPEVTLGHSHFKQVIWPRNHEETDEQFDLWLETNYSEKCFFKSTSNIQRLIKSKSVIAGNGTNGVKRGMWIHEEQTPNITKSEPTNFETLQRVHREVSIMLESANLEDIADRHRLQQLSGELRFLSNEIERRLNNTEYN